MITLEIRRTIEDLVEQIATAQGCGCCFDDKANNKARAELDKLLTEITPETTDDTDVAR